MDSVAFLSKQVAIITDVINRGKLFLFVPVTYYILHNNYGEYGIIRSCFSAEKESRYGKLK